VLKIATFAKPETVSRHLLPNINMKRHILILILFPLLTFSQKPIANSITKIKIKKNSNLKIETNSSDILYIGTNNIIVLSGPGAIQYSLSIVNGILTQNYRLTNDSCIAFDIKVNNTNPTYITFDNGRSTLKQKYRNKPIPNPQLSLNSKGRRYYSEEISDSTFQNVSSVSTTMFGFDYDLTMRLLSFKVKKVSSDSQVSNYTLQSTDIRAITKDAIPGDIFIFYDVLVEMCEPKEQRKINGLTFLIK